MAEQIFCKNCSKKIHNNEECYLTPDGIYCICCYDKKIKEAILKITKTQTKNGNIKIKFNQTMV